MRSTQDIQFNVTGQSIYFDCPEGRPSSVTSMTVYAWNMDDDGTAESAIGSPAVETNPNTTLDAAAGAGQADPRLIPVTATTGAAVGRTLLLTGADGFREWVEVIEVDSAVSITARHPLHNTYASADTLQSTRITAAIDATWVADETNLSADDGPNPSYRARVVYEVASVPYVHDFYFDLVRYPGQHGVAPGDIEVMHPNWLSNLPTDHRRDQGRRLIDDAYRAVKLDLHEVWRADELVANAEIVDELVRYKTIEAGEWSRYLASGGDPARYEMAHKAYGKRFDALVRVTDKTPSRTADGAGAQRAALQLTRR